VHAVAIGRLGVGKRVQDEAEGRRVLEAEPLDPRSRKPGASASAKTA
jgi:hypothetical protein